MSSKLQPRGGQLALKSTHYTVRKMRKDSLASRRRSLPRWILGGLEQLGDGSLLSLVEDLLGSVGVRRPCELIVNLEEVL